MSHPSPWLLPEGIHNTLPAQAQTLETLRRQLLDLYRSWGYELVMPPFIEYLDALLIGTGADLELDTFKLIDQLSGRMMGIRADMTPQVARMEAHQLQRAVPTRLCYIGTVLRTQPQGLSRSRSPLQVGAELYGHAGVASDIEILRLLLATLATVHLTDLHIDVGHVAIYRSLLAQAQLNAEQSEILFDIVQRKAQPELQQCLAEWSIAENLRTPLAHLLELNGNVTVLSQARAVLQTAPPAVHQALDELEQVAVATADNIQFDLAELRGYGYHTGLVFNVYVDGYGDAIAQGGRYDDIGKTFGRARPAVGFSTDLKILAAVGQLSTPSQEAKIYAPANDDAKLQQKINQLRQQGRCVIQALSGQNESAQQMGCQQHLSQRQGQWRVMDITL